MATREAAVRLSLQAGSYLAGLQAVQQKTLGALKAIGGALKGPMGAGWGAMKESAKGMGESMKGALSAAAGFGGLFAVGDAVKGAGELKSKYRDLAFGVEQATGKATDWADIQRVIEPMAQQTGRTSMEMAEAFGLIRAKTGNLSFASQALKIVGTAATASGASVEEMAGLVGEMNQKFGISAQELPTALAGVLQSAGKAGVSIADLSDELGSFASAALSGGLTGARGMNILMDVMTKTRPRVKDLNEVSAGIEQSFEKLSDPGMFDQIKQAAGVVDKNFGKGADIGARLRTILAAGDKARGKLGEIFTGREEIAALNALTDPFEQAFVSAKNAGKSMKEAESEGLKAYDEALKKAAKSTGDYSKIQKKAEDRSGDPDAQIRKAKEAFAQAFTNPEMLAAMAQLAQQLPALAQGMAKLVTFAVNNPLLAGGMAVGGKLGLSFAGGAAGNALSAVGGAGAKAIGSQIASSFAADVAANGKWGAIGKNLGLAAGIAMAAYAAYELGKKEIDKVAAADRGAAFSLTSAATAAEVMAGQKAVPQEEKRKALASLKAKLAEEEASKQDIRGGLLNKVTFGAYAMARETDAGKDDSMAQAEAAVRKLEASLTAGGAGGDALAASTGKAAQALDAFTQQLTKAGTNGLPKAPGTAPGAGG